MVCIILNNINDKDSLFETVIVSVNCSSKFLQLIEYIFLKTWCSLSGFIVQRNSRAYGYIADSLLYFPDRVQLRTLFKELGFDVVYSRKLYLGILEIIVVSKVKKLQWLNLGSWGYHHNHYCDNQNQIWQDFLFIWL